MSIERFGNGLEVHCDKCSSFEAAESGETFNELISRIRRDGWRVSQLRGEWLHECPLHKAEDFD